MEVSGHWRGSGRRGFSGHSCRRRAEMWACTVRPNSDLGFPRTKNESIGARTILADLEAQGTGPGAFGPGMWAGTL